MSFLTASFPSLNEMYDMCINEMYAAAIFIHLQQQSTSFVHCAYLSCTDTPAPHQSSIARTVALSGNLFSHNWLIQSHYVDSVACS